MNEVLDELEHSSSEFDDSFEDPDYNKEKSISSSSDDENHPPAADGMIYILSRNEENAKSIYTWIHQ